LGLLELLAFLVPAALLVLAVFKELAAALDLPAVYLTLLAQRSPIAIPVTAYCDLITPRLRPSPAFLSITLMPQATLKLLGTTLGMILILAPGVI
jgi:hypothetical protein